MLEANLAHTGLWRYKDVQGCSGMGGTGTVQDAAYQSHHLLHLFAGEVEEGLNEVTVEKALAGAPARVAFVGE